MKRRRSAVLVAALSLVVSALQAQPAGAARPATTSAVSTTDLSTTDLSTFLAKPITVRSLLVEVAQRQESEVATTLEKAGWRVEGVATGLVTVAAGPDVADNLRRLRQVPGVRSATAAAPAVSSAEADVAAAAGYAAATGEGSIAIGVPEWRAVGITGKGTRLAIVDTGFAGWAAAAAVGRVPALVFDPQRDMDYCAGGFEQTNHGTATAEIIHDVAPDAELVRVCINDAAGLAHAVPRLIAQHVQIVNMSVGFYNTARGDGQGGPLSPDSSVRQAVGAGILWVNSAGNEAQLHWGGPYSDEGVGVHHWQPGRSQMAFTLPPKSPVTTYLKWDEWNAPVDDFSLCLALTPTDAPSCYPSDVASRGTPTASIGLTNPSDQPVTLYASVKRTAGTGSPRLDTFFVGAGSLELPVPESSLAEPAAVDGVVSVGAECPVTQLVRPYSSRGPTLDGRPGITIVAPSAASSFIFGPASGCEGGYAGTSVSAPHVAAALALLHDLLPAASNVQLIEQLRTRAGLPPVPGIARPDKTYGYGVLSLGPPGPRGNPQPPAPIPPSFAAYASGNQQIPATDSPAWSWSEFGIGNDATTLQYSARVFGLRNPSKVQLRLGSPDEPGATVAELNVPGQPGASGCVEVASYTIVEQPIGPGPVPPGASGPCAALIQPAAAPSDALCPSLLVAPPPESPGERAGRPPGYCGFSDIFGTVTTLDLLGPLAGRPVTELIDLIRQGKVSVTLSSSALPAGAIRGQLVPWGG